MQRLHCSELADVEVPAPKLTLIRHFLMQEDDSNTVEEGFSITPRDKWDEVLHTSDRSTVLTEKENIKEGWDVTEEDILDRAKDELGNTDPIVEGIKFLLNQIEQQDNRIKELSWELAKRS